MLGYSESEIQNRECITNIDILLLKKCAWRGWGRLEREHKKITKKRLTTSTHSLTDGIQGQPHHL
jgi:hypothetical protein